MSDHQIFEPIAIEWYVRMHAIPALINKRFSSGETLNALKNPHRWRHEVIEWIAENHVFPSRHSVNRDDEGDRLLLVTRERLFPRYDFLNEHRTIGISSYICELLIREPSCWHPSFDSREASILRLSIGQMLAEAREDEIVTSDITSINTALPLSAWPVVLERAWMKNYVVRGSGPDAVFYLLKNAQTLRNAIQTRSNSNSNSSSTGSSST